MKKLIQKLISLLVPQRREGVTPPQDSPVSSCFPSALEQNIPQETEISASAEGNRYATTGEIYKNTVAKRTISDQDKLIHTFVRHDTYNSRGKNQMTSFVMKFNGLEPEIKKFKGNKLKTTKLRSLGEKIAKKTDYIENNWEKISKKEKNELQKLAYEMIDDNKTPSFIDKTWVIFYLSLIKMRGQKKDFDFCLKSLENLIDMILDKIEINNDYYQRKLSDILKEAEANLDTLEEINPNESKEWFRKLSDSTWEELHPEL
jgi:hypothetical protein